MTDIPDYLLYDVMAERRHQDDIHGGSYHDDVHSQEEWIALAVEHLGRCVYSTPGAFRAEMIKVAALAFAALESIDRKMDAE